MKIVEIKKLEEITKDFDFGIHIHSPSSRDEIVLKMEIMQFKMYTAHVYYENMTKNYKEPNAVGKYVYQVKGIFIMKYLCQSTFVAHRIRNSCFQNSYSFLIQPYIYIYIAIYL